MKTNLILVLVIILMGGTSLQSLAQAPDNNKSKQLFKDKNELVAHAKKQTTSISFKDFKAQYDKKDMTLIIDIRTQAETDQGYIPGSVLMPRGVLEFRIAKKEAWESETQPMPAKYETFILYCRSGNRAAVAAKSLQELGYANVKYLVSGWTEWHETYPEIIEVSEE